MRTLLTIWIGQFASLLGSEMTNFAITIWAWEVSDRATALSFILVAQQIPRLLISPFAGIICDRFSRKQLMLLGDFVAGLSTIVLLVLFLSDRLEIWHLYISGAINGLFGYIQALAYSASMSLMVAKQHYARAAALQSLQISGGYVLAPALAGSIYAIAGLGSILAIDLGTFVVAILTLSLVSIPQPNSSETDLTPTSPKLQQLTFGLRYLWTRPSLLALLSFFLINNFIDSLNFAILPAMVLARSGNDATIVGTLYAFFGAGGAIGGLTISIWGGPKRRIHGVLTGNIIWKFGLVVLALAQRTSVKMGTAFVSGFCSPFPSSSSQAIWMAAVEPEVQGRVFATRFFLGQLAAPLGAAIAGPLADRVFEPAMQPGGTLASILGSIFGTGQGAGMALQMTLVSICGAIVALGGYGIRQLRRVELEKTEA